jgi:hypothetical protein
MAKLAKFLQGVAGAAGGAGLDITEVFSTYLYEGNGTTSRVITNGIDLSNEGGLVWTKTRSNSLQHTLYDTERGAAEYLGSNETHYSLPQSNSLTSFNSDGFTVGNWLGVNLSGRTYASWTFRKAPKFFDVVTYTGTGSAQNISHDLGSVPGMIIVKQTDVTNNWMVQHRAFGGSHRLQLNSTDAAGTTSSVWNNTDPTSTVFTVGAHTSTNASGGTYVAYLFAHNDGDGEFGPDSDADIIKCGSYTGNGSTDGPEIDLGFEPQWVMIKGATAATSWYMFDNMRGITSGGNDVRLQANQSDAEYSLQNAIALQANGFKLENSDSNWNGSGYEYIYIAIRRGPMAVPEDATDVFAIDNNGGTSSGNAGALTSGFPVDLVLYRQTTSSNTDVVSRVNSTRFQTNLTNAENSSSRAAQLDFMDGYGNGTFASDYVGWMWRRAPGYFDVVAYTGTGDGNEVHNHNLGAIPELAFIKCRSSSFNWAVWTGGPSEDNNYLVLNSTAAQNDNLNMWGNVNNQWTDTTFSLGNDDTVNRNGEDYIAYLFATLDGISKVGSYTGTGNTLNIDCGFTSGARFVLIKRTDNQSPWWMWDSERGIVAGNDPFLELNSTAAETTSADYIDPYSSGFALTSNGNWLYGMNYPSGTYIFYAIA